MSSICKISLDIMKNTNYKQFLKTKKIPKLSSCTCKDKCNFSHNLNKYNQEKSNFKNIFYTFIFLKI